VSIDDEIIFRRYWIQDLVQKIGILHLRYNNDRSIKALKALISKSLLKVSRNLFWRDIMKGIKFAIDFSIVFVVIATVIYLVNNLNSINYLN
jgi:hypothetical protein